VNSVLPGLTLSEGVKAIFAEEQARTGLTIEQLPSTFIKQHRGGSIIQRATGVEEVANLVTSFSSPFASATTGASVRVDGSSTPSDSNLLNFAARRSGCYVFGELRLSRVLTIRLDVTP
jgi:hypothetical protein